VERDNGDGADAAFAIVGLDANDDIIAVTNRGFRKKNDDLDSGSYKDINQGLGLGMQNDRIAEGRRKTTAATTTVNAKDLVVAVRDSMRLRLLALSTCSTAVAGIRCENNHIVIVVASGVRIAVLSLRVIVACYSRRSLLLSLFAFFLFVGGSYCPTELSHFICVITFQ